VRSQKQIEPRLVIRPLTWNVSQDSLGGCDFKNMNWFSFFGSRRKEGKKALTNNSVSLRPRPSLSRRRSHLRRRRRSLGSSRSVGGCSLTRGSELSLAALQQEGKKRWSVQVNSRRRDELQTRKKRWEERTSMQALNPFQSVDPLPYLDPVVV